MKWYFHVIKNYAEFNGRARRKEYWLFILFNLIFSLAAMVLDSELGTSGIVYLIYAVIVALPSLAVTVRRLHDVEKSGWYILILLIPFIGAIGIIALTIKDGETGPNEYGPDPKGTIYNLT